MDWKAIYDAFIKDRKEHTTQELYSQLHHIVPIADGGPDREDNLVRLCIRDHQFAHKVYDRWKGTTTCPIFTRITAQKQIASLQRNGVAPARAKLTKIVGGRFRSWLNAHAHEIADSVAKEIVRLANADLPELTITPTIAKKVYPAWTASLAGLCKGFEITAPNADLSPRGPGIRLPDGTVMKFGLAEENDAVIAKIAEYLDNAGISAITDGVARTYVSDATPEIRAMLVETTLRMCRASLNELKCKYKVSEWDDVCECVNRYYTRVAIAHIINCQYQDWIGLLEHPFIYDAGNKVAVILASTGEGCPIDPAVSKFVYPAVRYALGKYIIPGTNAISADRRDKIAFAASEIAASMLVMDEAARKMPSPNELNMIVWRCAIPAIFSAIQSAEAKEAKPAVEQPGKAYSDEGLHASLLNCHMFINERIKQCITGMVAAKLKQTIDEGRITQVEYDYLMDFDKIWKVLGGNIKAYNTVVNAADPHTPKDQFAKKTLFGFAAKYARSGIAYILASSITEDYGRIAQYDHQCIGASVGRAGRLTIAGILNGFRPGEYIQLPQALYMFVNRAVDDLSFCSGMTKAELATVKGTVGGDLVKLIIDTPELRHATVDQLERIAKETRFIALKRVRETIAARGGKK